MARRASGTWGAVVGQQRREQRGLLLGLLLAHGRGRVDRAGARGGGTKPAAQRDIILCHELEFSGMTTHDSS